MSSPFVPIETADLLWRDGLPYSRRFEDIYFSNDNGLDEALPVFINGNQLIQRWQELEDATFVIAETGFGSGLNFLLAWSCWLKYAPKSARLHFISCEKFPLTKEDLRRCLALWPALETQASALLAEYPVLTPGFHHLQFDEGRVSLTLMLGEANACFNQLLLCGNAELEKQLRTSHVNAWFLDGFAPSKNEAMWSEELFYSIALLSKEGTTLATFSAAKVVRKNLEHYGFKVEKIKGFGRKREMVRAFFQQLKGKQTLKYSHTPWHIKSPVIRREKTALIIGAGLAGCYSAYALAKRNWNVKLLDAQAQVGQGASGNRQAVLYPKLSAYRSPLTAFMLAAFQYAQRFYAKLLEQESIGELLGILQLAFDQKELLSQKSLETWLDHYPQLGRLLTAEEASQFAGIELKASGLLIPDSGWLDSQALCQWLIKGKGIHWLPETLVTELNYSEGKWQAGEHSADVIIIATGYQASQFAQTAHLPFKPIRGQMTFIASNKQSKQLKIPLCGDGHILPANNQRHAVGATYHLGARDSQGQQCDDLINLERLTRIPGNLEWPKDVLSNWVGVRATTPDYLPMVGPVPEEEPFRERFASLASNSKRWLPLPGAYYPGLFICAGFGSRGLTSIPFAAEWLVSLINNELSFLPRTMIQAISPARFIRKKIAKGLN